MRSDTSDDGMDEARCLIKVNYIMCILSQYFLKVKPNRLRLAEGLVKPENGHENV